jgi:hypothetical protein
MEIIDIYKSIDLNYNMNYTIINYGSFGGPMKSITIHGIDNDLDQKISEKAKKYGLSQNRTVKYILQSTLLADQKAAKREAFSDLFGKWTSKEKDEFDNRIKDFEKIDETDWNK